MSVSAKVETLPYTEVLILFSKNFQNADKSQIQKSVFGFFSTWQKSDMQRCHWWLNAHCRIYREGKCHTKNASFASALCGQVSIVGKIYRELIANVHEFCTCKTYKLFLWCLPVVVCDSSSLCLASALCIPTLGFFWWNPSQFHKGLEGLLQEFRPKHSWPCPLSSVQGWVCYPHRRFRVFSGTKKTNIEKENFNFIGVIHWKDMKLALL